MLPMARTRDKFQEIKRKCLLFGFEYHVRAESFNKLLLLYVHLSLLTWRTSKPFRFLIRQQNQQTMCRGRQMLRKGTGVVGVWEWPNSGHLHKSHLSGAEE